MGRDSAWAALLSRPLFKGAAADTERSGSLQHLESIFAERSHLLYKAAEVQVCGDVRVKAVVALACYLPSVETERCIPASGHAGNDRW